MPDIEKLQRTVQFIKDHPEKHQQEVWSCDTGACFAGWAVLLHGWQQAVWGPDHLDYAGTAVHGQVVPDGMDPTYVVDRAKRTSQWVRDVAVKELDLKYEEAQLMFHGSNTIDVLELMVKDISNGENLTDLWSTESDGENSWCERKEQNA